MSVYDKLNPADEFQGDRIEVEPLTGNRWHLWNLPVAIFDLVTREPLVVSATISYVDLPPISFSPPSNLSVAGFDLLSKDCEILASWSVYDEEGQLYQKADSAMAKYLKQNQRQVIRTVLDTIMAVQDTIKHEIALKHDNA